MISKIKVIVSGFVVLAFLMGLNVPTGNYGIKNVPAVVKAEGQTSNYVSVSKFGAVGDGVTDDYQSIKNALDYVKGTSQVLYFPNGDYYCSKKLIVNRTCIIQGESKELTSITFKDRTQKGDTDVWLQRGLFTFCGSSLKMSNITFRYIADNDTSYARSKTQESGTVNEGVLVSILSGSDIQVDNCYFWVGGQTNPSITCMWLKAESESISNVRITNSKFENDSRATVGGSLWLSSHDKPEATLSDIVISGCELIKHANDEALALWGFNVSNVLITDNDISYSGEQVQNDVLLSFGMPSSDRIESLRDVHFTGNRIHINGRCIAAVKFQRLSDDSIIDFSSNVIDGKISKKTTFECVWFYKSGSVNFRDNVINVSGGKRVSFIKKKHQNDVTLSGNSFNRRR